MGDMRVITETGVHTTHYILETDFIRLLQLTTTRGAIVTLVARESLSHLASEGVPAPMGLRVVTTEPIQQAAPIDKPI